MTKYLTKLLVPSLTQVGAILSEIVTFSYKYFPRIYEVHVLLFTVFSDALKRERERERERDFAVKNSKVLDR